MNLVQPFLIDVNMLKSTCVALFGFSQGYVGLPDP